jgi:hypothetical protein
MAHIGTTMTSDNIIATVTLDTIIAFYTVTAFVIPLVTLLTSTPVTWREEHLWNFCVLQRLHLSNLVLYIPIKECSHYFHVFCF